VINFKGSVKPFTIKCLQAIGHDLNHGMSVLRYTIWRDNKSGVLRYNSLGTLIELGADPNRFNLKGMSLLEYALTKKAIIPKGFYELVYTDDYIKQGVLIRVYIDQCLNKH
jgi:hypothetical protein